MSVNTGDAPQTREDQFADGNSEENVAENPSAEELLEEIILNPPKGRKFIVTTVPRNLPAIE